MKLIKISDGNDRIHYININYIVDVFDRKDRRHIITAGNEIHTNETIEVILRKITEAESNS
ncbi:hypothetical protein [Flavobacterium piscisymbiosum]|uniref:Phage protein n=1 Tax=Flavobacterium piscisymbiosum TaxID=2893753 RepID=A0ABS8MN64_9FLAO|nr:hypothetical protein [Flavobacterium sp. F-30]MCC9066307.1 hypothetical protein [Flavobacterium sp. F-30]